MKMQTEEKLPLNKYTENNEKFAIVSYFCIFHRNYNKSDCCVFFFWKFIFLTNIILFIFVCITSYLTYFIYFVALSHHLYLQF